MGGGVPYLFHNMGGIIVSPLQDAGIQECENWHNVVEDELRCNAG